MNLGICLRFKFELIICFINILETYYLIRFFPYLFKFIFMDFRGEARLRCFDIKRQL
jgi:hypothetical protein